MQLDKIHSAYFIGIGGIGMSALARYFNSRGVRIAGYDRTETKLTKTLVAEGMEIHYEDDVNQIPKQIDLVVYTPAIPASHKELSYLQAENFPVYKRSAVLGMISKDKRSIAIAGTHGKTTTSSITGHVLRSAGLDCTAFLGGIAANFQSNFVDGKSDWVLAEADEFDRSFLQLFPDIAVILSMDPDHLDIYGNPEAMNDSYRAFAGQIKKDGLLIYHAKLEEKLKSLEVEKSLSYGFESGDVRATNLKVKEGCFQFDIQTSDKNIKGIKFPFPGKHNVENAVAAAAVALELNLEPEAIKKALESFKGIKRRFEFVIRNEEQVFIDDYAHHPEELKAAISAAKMLYENKKITGIFQPHLFSRTKDFADGFASALDELDELWLLDIYPAREEPIEGVNSGMILKLMKNKNAKLIQKEELINELKNNKIEVLMTLGAGDIDKLVLPIKSELLKT